MNLGVHVTGHVASRAIVSEAHRAGHIVQGIDFRKLPDIERDSFDAIVLANVMDPIRIAALLSWVSPDCHLIFVSTYKALPSGLTSIPWSEEDFDPTAEPVSKAGEGQAARLAERVLILAGQNVNWTILRPAIVEGSHDPDPLHTRWFVERVLSSDPICLPDEDEQAYRHVSTRDLGRAIITILGVSRVFGKILQVCSDGILTPSLQARAVAEAFKTRAEIQYVPTSAWDRVGLERPMAGRNGSALMASSPTLIDLGWTPTPPTRFINNLARELKAQPRCLNPRMRNLELSLAGTKEFSRTSGKSAEACWVLRSSGRSGNGILAVHQMGDRKPWKTIAVALGQDVQRNATLLNASGLERPLAAPMLVEIEKTGLRQRKIVYGEFARDSLDGVQSALDVPTQMGEIALLAFPLAMLLESWPKVLPEGDIWILGRGLEAWLAANLAGAYNRSARLIGLEKEPTTVCGLPALESLEETITTTPALIINVSGESIQDEHVAGNLHKEGILVTPELYRTPLAHGRSIRLLVDRPNQKTMLQALQLITDWNIEKRHPNCFYRLPLDSLDEAFIAPALQLPVLFWGD
jgi:nucleoside-diphosphate-sugar epimerase